MVAVKKDTIAKENPNDPNVRDPEHKHELGGTLGMVIGGITGGIAAGAATGAAVGGVTSGPVGAIVGAAIGGAIGGVAGESIARDVNPTAEEQYWQENHHTRSYAKGSDFEAYRPAYRLGAYSFTQFPDDEFENLEPNIRNDWGNVRGDSNLEWNDAREAARDAFERLKDQNRT